MKIATFNINSINARLNTFILWLRTTSPDVVLLQEIKTEFNNFPFFEINAEGYHAVVFGQKGYNGVAVLSKKNVHLLNENLPELQTARPDISKFCTMISLFHRFICQTAIP